VTQTDSKDQISCHSLVIWPGRAKPGCAQLGFTGADWKVYGWTFWWRLEIHVLCCWMGKKPLFWIADVKQFHALTYMLAWARVLLIVLKGSTHRWEPIEALVCARGASCDDGLEILSILEQSRKQKGNISTLLLNFCE
jgi:hypothetical protein